MRKTSRLVKENFKKEPIKMALFLLSSSLDMTTGKLIIRLIIYSKDIYSDKIWSSVRVP